MSKLNKTLSSKYLFIFGAISYFLAFLLGGIIGDSLKTIGFIVVAIGILTLIRESKQENKGKEVKEAKKWIKNLMPKSKYYKKENELLSYYSRLLNEDFQLNYNEARYTSKKFLDEAIKEAGDKGLRDACDLGDIKIKDEVFLKKRLKAGLQVEDIQNFWNHSYLSLLIEDKIQNLIRFMSYNQLIKEGLDSEKAILKLRKSFIYFGDPEKSHVNFQKEDADIYVEFRTRHEKWRRTISIEEEQKKAQEYQTYNAMIRDLIRKGEM